MKEIKDFPGYFVTPEGKVYSSWARCSRKSFIDYTTKKELKSYIGKNGYSTVRLQGNCKQRLAPIHRLVAETYLPIPFEGACVNHKDENKLNNRLENLEFVTRGQNAWYSCRKQHKVEATDGSIIIVDDLLAFSKSLGLQNSAQFRMKRKNFTNGFRYLGPVGL